jgi:hypothetical protein
MYCTPRSWTEELEIKTSLSKPPAAGKKSVQSFIDANFKSVKKGRTAERKLTTSRYLQSISPWFKGAQSLVILLFLCTPQVKRN